MKPITFTRVKRKLIRIFFREQWSLLLLAGGKDGFLKPSGKNGRILKEIIPPRDFQWADPFIVEWEGKTYIFVEQQYKHENGTLGFIELFTDLSHSAFVPILEKFYHLSFPNIFRYENEWYMIPESHENRTIDLYKAKDFPATWEFETTLMRDIDAVDSIVFFHNTKWWIFTSVKRKSFNDNLCLFYADAFPTDKWTPHLCNPVCADVTNSRMAGAIFCDDSGKIYRAAQNCLKDYGKETNINEIIELTETSYKERIVKTIFPEKEMNVVCTHTLNFSENHVVRDVKTRVWRI
ncbi:MAG: hypothetical protein LBG05_07150 [Treponema sp.]|nr:hypothetical protein [Treponema sp.]